MAFELAETAIAVQVQGEVLVNRAWCHKAQEPEKLGIAIVEVDLKTKYAELMCYSNGVIQGDQRLSGPSFMLMTNENTLYKSETDSGPTQITIPEFRGWDVFCVSLSRYSLRVCLTSELL